MQLRKLLQSEEDRAVSPVIGVILMVAITVILAAVIGTFVLGLGDQVQETSPNTQWSWSTSGDDVTLTHDGGDTVNAEQLRLTGPALDQDYNDLTATEESLTEAFTENRVSAGDSITLDSSGTAGSAFTADEEIRLVWTSDGGGQSSTLSRYTFQG